MSEYTLLNTKTINTVEVYDESINLNYEYVPKRSWLFGLIKDVEHYKKLNPWDSGDRIEMSELEKILSKGNIIINKDIYQKPRLVFNLSNDESHTIYFDSSEKRDNYVKKKLNHISLIKLKNK